MNKILAIDVGTASVSGACAQHKFGEKTEITQVFRFFLDSLEKDQNRKIVGRISKIFSETHKFKHNIDIVKIGFSSPFFIERTVFLSFERKDNKKVISYEELENSIESFKNENEKKLATVSFEMIESKVNGYVVADPVGYKGKFLEFKVKIFSISSSLKEYIEKLKEKFFPKAEISYFSDLNILEKTISDMYKKSDFLLVDIGGEITTVANYDPLPFGIRVLERMVSSSLKIDLEDSESVLRIFASGSLDWRHERAMRKILDSSSDVFWNLFKEVIEKNNLINLKTLFLTGAGANFPIFGDKIKNNFKKVFNLDVEIIIFTAETLKDKFSYLKPLAGGEDAVLTSLVLI